MAANHVSENQQYEIIDCLIPARNWDYCMELRLLRGIGAIAGESSLYCMQVLVQLSKNSNEALFNSPFLLNLIQPIFFTNSNFAPTNNIIPRSTAHIITVLTYVGKLGSNKLLERSTVKLLFDTCEEMEKELLGNISEITIVRCMVLLQA